MDVADDFEGDTATCRIENKLRKMQILQSTKKKIESDSWSFANVDIKAIVPEKKV